LGKNLSKGRGLVRHADFIRSDMMQGMGKIIRIEETLKQPHVVPTWESFTIERVK
jgi:hypothetical protein